jgi:hypothetical protein
MIGRRKNGRGSGKVPDQRRSPPIPDSIWNPFDKGTKDRLSKMKKR